MEFKDIVKYHRNAPKTKLDRHPDIQKAYDNDKTTEKELRSRLFNNNQVWVLTENKYPYYFIDNTKHYVMWFDKKINYTLINFLLREYDQIVYFENIQQCKSIKSIPHVHIFIK